MAQIKRIKLPGVTEPYDIYDATAIHSLEDIQGLGLEGAFIFKGTVATVADLPSKGNNVGWVYHVTENESEYVWVTGNKWEEFGHHMVVEHTHNISTSATLAGSAFGVNIVGKNEASAVTGTGTGSVSVPKVSKSANRIKVDSSLSEVGVSASGTAKAITGFADPTTKQAIVSLNTTSVNNPTASDVSIPNVTGNDAVVASKVTVEEGKEAAVWQAQVDDEGVLSFTWSVNKLPKVTATDVNASKVTLGKAIAASKVTTKTVTVATGPKNTSNFITALGEASTADVVTGLTVTQPTLSVTLDDAADGEGIYVGDTIAVTSESKNITVNVTGSAAAQKWSQTSGTITGTAAITISGTTGKPN